ncbi:pleckstrin homology domain-containing family F member 1 [Latimeria chalumnae]|uniref:Pleckstrin homology domain-containing family F member 1 n=1 Tax=Latimeria chalumnae TaxID=7897 RepID=H3ALM8_LATCH|nr:PREDICTED: pleckstrin homology domain-containing family F member 1 [Latimeria chalumnae]|eukprot:XP_006008746.1 PREDICTED: pleckstrin homology domain-containing family F member 1 [Latimeria chalumnae]
MVDHLAYTEINADRISCVENCFGASGQPLAKPGRVLVGEGILTKVCRREPKPKVFFLFNDILVYGSIVINKKKYNSQHIIPLEHVTLENLPDTDHLKNVWIIKTVKKSFIVSAASSTEKMEWISHTERMVKQLLEKIGKEPTTEHAAVWVPDKATDICMRCTKSKFSALNRRHHCRKCGFVVCGACSRNRFVLPMISPNPLRVCGLCYKHLEAVRRKEAEEERQQLEAYYSAMPTYEASSDEDSDEKATDEKAEEWPGQEAFYSSNTTWSSFHS